MVVNVNCGVLGHIDSGKTSLCKALHQIASTASMDKHPQSKERGITLDLGFSSFISHEPTTGIQTQVTLVDCPGHAGLIRTVLGGAQIIDFCLLVLDAQKGFQTQTGECLVIAEIVTSKLIVVVNKMDLICPENSEEFQVKFAQNVRSVMSKTTFGGDCPIVFVSSLSGVGLNTLRDQVRFITTSLPLRDPSGLFHFSFDHAFSVKGQGSVFTGTVISGSVRKGQKLIFPYTRETGEVRSIQKFRVPAEFASQGDRVGLCIPGVSSDKERGDIYSDTTPTITSTVIIFVVRRIRFYKMGIKNGSNFHIAIGHNHCMGIPYFFKSRGSAPTIGDINGGSSSSQSLLGKGGSCSVLNRDMSVMEKELTVSGSKFDLIEDMSAITNEQSLYCAVVFSKPVTCLPGSLMIASKLDLDEDHQSCRLAFYGKALPILSKEVLTTKIVKQKIKAGIIDRQHHDDCTYLVRGLLKKGGGGVDRYIGRTLIHESSRSEGRIDSTFGKAGLLKVIFPTKLPHNSVGTQVSITVEKPALAKILDRV
jgi:selenocysteine-specific elongation factor